MNNNVEKELVSVIIPVYNTKKYIDECLKSVFSQTFSNLEILIIDDGSTDGTGEICDQYLNVDDRVKVFHKKNEGLGLTRNYGIDVAKGKYICFLDSDDKLSLDFIENLYENLINYNVDVCKAGFTRFKNDDIIKEIKYDTMVYVGNEVKTQFLPRLIGAAPDKHDSVEMAACGVLYKSSIIKEHCIRFPSERELISEDIVFNIKYFQFANGGCLLNNTGYFYRINNASLTRSYRVDRFEKSKYFYKYIRELLEELGYGNDTMYRLDRYFFICLRKCLQQEKNNPEKNKIINNLKNICYDAIVNEIINKYPINRLGLKQKIFLYLIKKKKILLLKFLIINKFV